MNAREHILVIGGAGYVGSVLVRRLLAQGFRVRVLDALIYDNRASLSDLLDNERFSFVQGDFCDPGLLRQALEGVDHLVMLAALVGDPICRKYPEEARRVNEFGTLDMLRRVDDTRIQRLVFMSTCSNYGLRATDEPADEDCALNPQSLYAETKVEVERFLLEAPARFSFTPTVLRGATAFGESPRMRFDLTVNEFTGELAVGHELTVYDADTWRPYCHLDDFAQAMVAVLEAPIEEVGGQVFNLGDSRENYTKRMMVELLKRVIPEARIVFREGSTDPRNYRVTFEKIRTALTFDAQTSVRTFIPELVASISHGNYADFASHKERYGNYRIAKKPT